MKPMRIDSHQHFWQYDPQRDAWITDEMSVLKRDFLPADLLPELTANGMDGCIAVQADQSEKETAFLLDLASAHDAIKGVVGWVDLRSTQLPGRLQYFSQYEKLRGFRHIVQAEPGDRFMLQPDFCRGISKLKEFRFTYDILIYPKQLNAALDLVQKFSEQRFVIDHLAKPLVRIKEIDAWARSMQAIAQNPNVYCKLSGIVTEADWKNWKPADFVPYLDVVFEAFGPKRLMFGSDWPVCLLAGSFQQVKELIEMYTNQLTSHERDRIFGLNAVEFYGLKS
jgi:L-fuconolactonase